MTDTERKKIISVLISERSRRQACEKLGISQRTMYNYMHDAEFLKEYQDTVDGIIKDTETRTREAGLIAINHLISVIQDEDVDQVTRIKADRVVLEHLSKMIDCDNKYW